MKTVKELITLCNERCDKHGITDTDRRASISHIYVAAYFDGIIDGSSYIADSTHNTGMAALNYVKQQLLPDDPR